jgi:diaminopimelate decarboxylase
MNIGDWIVFGGMGSYSIGPSSEFNGMTSLSKVIVYNSEDKEVKNK